MGSPQGFLLQRSTQQRKQEARAPSPSGVSRHRRMVENGFRVLGQRSVGLLAWAFAANRVIWILAGGIALIGLALRLIIAWQDTETLALKTIADDGFYYLQTADRIASGQNLTFDGLTLSNGYHPLWLFFLVPLYLLPGRGLPLHFALTASAVFDVTAGGLVGLAVGKLTGNRVAALFALTLYLFIPQNVLASVNGVESALTGMLLGALLLTLVSVWRQKQDNWIRWSVVTGILGGLMVLARLESALVLAAVLALIALFQSGTTRWRAPLAAGVIAGIVVAPWFLWSFIALGTVMPVSAESTTWILRTFYSADHPGADLLDRVGHGLSYTKSQLLTRLPDLYFPAKPFAALLLTGMGLAGAHYLLLSRGAVRRRTTGQIVTVALPFGAFAVMFFFNSAYRWLVREWYFAWGAPLVALLAGVVFAYGSEVIGQSRLFSSGRPGSLDRGTARLLLYCGLVVLLAFAYSNDARDTWQRGLFTSAQIQERLEAAAYLRSNTDPADRVAAFNAGVIGYFSERVVINLDGVVNPDAFQALREHRLLDYLRAMDVTYAADRVGPWMYLRPYIRPDDWSESLWGEDPNRAFVTVAEFGGGSIIGQIRIWRLAR